MLEDERQYALLDARIRLRVKTRSLDGPTAVVRTDPAPGFKTLAYDPLLIHKMITP